MLSLIELTCNLLLLRFPRQPESMKWLTNLVALEISVMVTQFLWQMRMHDKSGYALPLVYIQPCA